MHDFVDKLIKNTWMEAHKKTIEGILQEVNQKSDAYILKGETSLMECYNLTRFSEDIDFDRFPTPTPPWTLL